VLTLTCAGNVAAQYRNSVAHLLRCTLQVGADTGVTPPGVARDEMIPGFVGT
jgi:hypothetical protein